MDRMSVEQWNRKYVDTHKGITALGQLMDKKHVVIKEPSDLNAKDVRRLKRPIERKCHQDRSKDLQNFVMDTVAVRAEDMLDKKQLPAKDLLKIAVSTIPKELNVTQSVTHSFTDLWNEVPVAEEYTDAEVSDE